MNFGENISNIFDSIILEIAGRKDSLFLIKFFFFLIVYIYLLQLKGNFSFSWLSYMNFI